MDVRRKALKAVADGADRMKSAMDDAVRSATQRADSAANVVPQAPEGPSWDRVIAALRAPVGA